MTGNKREFNFEIKKKRFKLNINWKVIIYEYMLNNKIKT